MSLSDGFRAFDTARKNRLDILQLYAGLKWLNIQPRIDDFKGIWLQIPKNASGYTTEVEFVRLFAVPDVPALPGDVATGEPDVPETAQVTSSLLQGRRYLQQQQSIGALHILSSNEIEILKEAEATGVKGGIELDNLDPRIYERFKFKLQPHSAFKKIWEGHLDRSKFNP